MTTKVNPIPYVQSAASQDVPPPYFFPGVTAYAFAWDAQLPPIRDYCGKFLNLGDEAEKAGFVYRPADFWPYALLLFIDYPVMVSTSPQKIPGEVPYSQRGIVSQTEVFVALPVVRSGDAVAPAPFDTELEWALPFIAVANPMSAVCGREMIGLPKLIAEIDIAEGAGSFAATVKLPGWETRGASQTPMTFLQVRSPPADRRGVLPAQSPWMTSQGGRASGPLMGGLAAAGELVNAAALGLMPLAMRTVSLRQYRDAKAPDEAVYQALVTCRSKYTNVRNVRFYNENDVDILFADTGSFRPIIRTFAEPPAARSKGRWYRLKPKVAFRFNADIDFDDMRTVHTFDRGPSLAALPQRSDLGTSWTRTLSGFFGPRAP